jgi:sodium/potassium-transporting ATPase subunit alpha
MTHLWPELVPLAINFILSMPLGIGALQLLSIDLATELAPAIALCYEKPENNLMSKPPRNIKTDKLFNKQVVSYAYF